MILFFAGLAGVAFETLSGGPTDDTLLLLFAAMMGLPIALHADERRNGKAE